LKALASRAQTHTTLVYTANSVPQGRVTSLTNAKDEERLQVLKEVAGTRVYEQRRRESSKIITETNAKREQIRSLLVYIDNKLSELDEEKEELLKFQEADRERRCLEYAIYIREQNDAANALEDLEIERKDEMERTAESFQVLAERERYCGEVEAHIRELKDTTELLEFERNQLESDMKEFITARAQIRLFLNDVCENCNFGFDISRTI
jgi:structural maintenance of chromosome 3 (chondroitin sulfate proteoglycan 6)